MRSACFVPIKANSERVPGKNFRILNGRKLYEYVLQHIKEADVFDDVYVDSNSEEILSYAEKMGFVAIQRKEELAKNSANGNDLLVYHARQFPNYEYYFQLFATAPYMQSSTIRRCAEILMGSEEYDSCFTAVAHYGFFWMDGVPVNYRPGILPRSQDLHPVVEETTGLYGISREALLKYNCRIGRTPYVFQVNKLEAVDLNVEDDFKMAEVIGKMCFNQK